ncbi:hypothetical protein [Actinokineospora sp. NBRC 105648]|uniref:hypothetical protein n=1 Tax=Actinokineospora sp. NBRC 105648 TaxID=3032206 RepID=UPI0024A32FEF|nr:hypothetical protein [Actinokineospora sp. NBRC 105648]GLZ36569.1 hypothetical protein Acsp05_01940 [Actinokineospora sp. NBRC 105648]
MECAIANCAVDRGWVLLPTNDQGYWQPSTRDTNDVEFRLHEGAMLAGTRQWSPNAGAGTTAGREDVLELVDRYRLRWRDFSAFPGTENGVFRVLAVPVSGRAAPARG